MTEPLVSVKMITYNHAPYIAQAIEGVLHQKTTFPFELLIGEDCSTDGTREIVFDYEKKYPNVIKVITSDKNVGMKKNGYRISKASRGKYIAFCEGDDYWHRPGKMQKQVNYLESHPECGLVHSDYDRYLVRSGRTIKNFNRVNDNKPPKNLDSCSILRGGKYLYILTCTVMLRKDLFSLVVDSDPVLYQSERFLIGDTQLWAEIAHKSKTHYMDESLSTYNVLPVSASKSSDIYKQLKFGKSVAEMCLYLVQKYDLPESEYEYHLKKWYNCALPLAFYERDKNIAIIAQNKYKYFSLKNKLFYLGINHLYIYNMLKIFICVKNLYLSLKEGRR